MKIQLISLNTLLLFSTMAYASQISLLPPKELNQKSEFIVFGQVLSVASDNSHDHLSVKVIDCLKGEIQSATIKVSLQVRGGLKEWSPELKSLDFGIFYLRKSDTTFFSAYGGSVAIFTKHQFQKYPTNVNVSTTSGSYAH
jgi:hypothetical protein